jgi:hypothetical protein
MAIYLTKKNIELPPIDPLTSAEFGVLKMDFYLFLLYYSILNFELNISSM